LQTKSADFQRILSNDFNSETATGLAVPVARAALRETKWNNTEMVLCLRKRVLSRNTLITHHIVAKTLKKE
jgi:hypothetical protein